MIIIRQKTYSRVQENQAPDDNDNINSNETELQEGGRKKLPFKVRAKIKSAKWKAKLKGAKNSLLNTGINVVNNPVGAVVDLGKDTITRPIETAGKVAIAVPFPASVPAGIGAIAIGKTLRKKVKPIGKISDGLRNKIEDSKFYKKVKGINLNIIKRNPYKAKVEKESNKENDTEAEKAS